MARRNQANNGQMSIEDVQKRKKNLIPRGSKYNKSKSNSYESVFDTKNGKEWRVTTPKGKFERNKEELASGKNSFTGEKLTDYQRGQRVGYNRALGEQANFHKGKQKK